MTHKLIEFLNSVWVLYHKDILAGLGIFAVLWFVILIWSLLKIGSDADDAIEQMRPSPDAVPHWDGEPTSVRI